MKYTEMTLAQRQAEYAAVRAAYEQQKSLSLNLNMARGKPGKSAGAHSDHQREERIYPSDEKRGRDGSSQREAAVHGKVGKIQQFIGDVNSVGQERIDEALGNGAFRKL